MQIPLDRWQEKLKCHFKELSRKRQGSELPLFAFEHCLTVDEFEQIAEPLKDHLSAGNCPGIYWLLWVVYATEIGYTYEGDEYWQSFEKQTTGWQSFHRDSLKRWFKKFQSTYSGFVPSGRWAEHFSNISWPITHAILPRYLQFQFASALYQHRYRLARLTALDSVSVGRLFRTQTYDVSTRFEKFLQQEELTGRIVLGLLSQTPQQGQEIIYSAALDRIVADLDRVRSTRGWLRETRRTVIDRFRGIGRGKGPSPERSTDLATNNRNAGTLKEPDICPSLFLRYSGSGLWAVAVDVPSFTPLAMLHQDLRSFLRRTRCRVAGAVDTKPSGWTISGNRVAILKSWPDPDNALLTFEKSHRILDGLLQSDCRISAGPNWLFRIGADGRAREIRNQSVHPGVTYIFLSLNSFQATPKFSKNCAVDCEGVCAIRISMPENLSSEETIELRSLGLKVARTIRVWPAGFPCRCWDGQGQSEWLTTERPQFGFVHDHPVESYRVYLNDNPELIVNAPEPGNPVFIQLNHLPAGKHRLTLMARRAGDGDDLWGYVEMKVREPEPWIPGVSAHSGLIVNIDPHDANLDELWSNDVDVSIIGPESHTVVCTLLLQNSVSEKIISEQIRGNFQLPVTPTVWRKHFSSVVNHDENAWHFLEAAAGRLEIDGGELGKYVLRFERDSLPVRWITKNVKRRMFLRLVDDTGHEGSEPTCRFFSMEKPVQAETLTLTSALKGIYPEKPGGLYVAQHDPHTDALVVSCGPTGGGFRGLAVESDVSDILTGSIPVAAAIPVLAWWLNARLVGFLPEDRRNRIVVRLRAAIYEKLCGANWSRAEEPVMNNPTDSRARETLLNRIGRNRSFNAAIKENTHKFRGEISETVNWYSELVRRYSGCKDLLLCEFSVILALEPHTLPEKYPNKLDQLIKKAVSNPEVIRGARCASIFNSLEYKQAISQG